MPFLVSCLSDWLVGWLSNSGLKLCTVLTLSAGWPETYSTWLIGDNFCGIINEHAVLHEETKLDKARSIVVWIVISAWCSVWMIGRTLLFTAVFHQLWTRRRHRWHFLIATLMKCFVYCIRLSQTGRCLDCSLLISLHHFSPVAVVVCECLNECECVYSFVRTLRAGVQPILDPSAETI